MADRLPLYVFRTVTGIYRYRRNVPEPLRSALGCREIKKTLGKDFAAAMRRYAVVHSEAESALKAATNGIPATTREEVVMLLKRAGITKSQLDLLISGHAGSDLQHELSFIADDLEEEHSVAERAGKSPRVSLDAIRAINAARIPPQTYTVHSALEFYLSAKATGDAVKDRQLTNRVNDLRKRMIEATSNEAITRRSLQSFTRQDAQRVRDALLTQVAPNSVKRMLTIVKAAVAMTIRENQLDIPNRFERLEIKGAGESKADRHPFSELDMTALAKIMEREATDELSALWVILRDTGARPGEICTLSVAQFRLDPMPFLAIEDGKNRNAKRDIPLSGDAVSRLQVLVEGRSPTEAIFPRYASGRGTDSASAALMKRLRTAVTDKKKVVYSLRHRMKDRLRDTGCAEALQREIMGHSGQGIAANYGRGYSLTIKHDALSRVWAQ